MNKTEHELRKTVLEICDLALNGQMSLDRFTELWPRGADAIPFLKTISDDIEDGIEHAPGSFLKGGIDIEAWQKSDMYALLSFDAKLLRLDKPLTDLMRYRQKAQESRDFSEQSFRSIVGLQES